LAHRLHLGTRKSAAVNLHRLGNEGDGPGKRGSGLT